MVIYFAIIICLFYVVIIFFLFVGIRRVKAFGNFDFDNQNGISMIIPYCNEENNLPQIFESILKQDLSKQLFQILFIDDNSTDNSAELVLEFANKNKSLDIHLVKLANGDFGKKRAIEVGVEVAKFDLILITDADCYFHEKRLSTIIKFYQLNQTELIICPVIPIVNNGFFNKICEIEFLSLMGVTIGSSGLQNALLCNGANLAFKKGTFLKLNPYKNNSKVCSGDDQFLLEEIKKNFSNRIKYLKSLDAAVYTELPNSLKSFWNQRVRWASKTKLSKDISIKLVAIITFLYNFLLVLFFFLFAFSSCFNYKIAFVMLLMVKIFIDFPLLFNIANFIKRKKNLLIYYIPTQIIYVFYISLIGIWANLNGKFTWKR